MRSDNRVIDRDELLDTIRGYMDDLVSMASSSALEFNTLECSHKMYAYAEMEMLLDRVSAMTKHCDRPPRMAEPGELL